MNLLFLRRFCIINLILLVAQLRAFEHSDLDRQQFLIDKMKESLSVKTTSKAYGDEFVELLKKINKPRGGILRFTIDDNSVCLTKVVCGNPAALRFPFVENIVRPYTASAKSIDFFIRVNDSLYLPDDLEQFVKEHIVLLSCENTKIDALLYILIPDFYISKPGSVFLDKIHSVKNSQECFSKRIPLAKFIGSQTGGTYNLKNIDTIPRLKAIHLAKEYPNLLKIDFTNYACQAENQEFIDYMHRIFGPPAPGEPHSKLPRYRYLLSFDGNCSAWERPEIIMHSGSVPLFQTRYEKFWTSLLEDGVNYIKIEDDLSNLIDTVEFLNNNPDYAQEIALQAQSLAEGVLTPDFIKKYFEELFKEVQALQNKEK